MQKIEELLLVKVKCAFYLLNIALPRKFLTVHSLIGLRQEFLPVSVKWHLKVLHKCKAF